MFFSYRICTTSIGKFPMGLIPIGYDPMNQTTSIGKFPIGSNPLKFLYYSFKSNEPLILAGRTICMCQLLVYSP